MNAVPRPTCFVITKKVAGKCSCSRIGNAFWYCESQPSSKVIDGVRRHGAVSLQGVDHCAQWYDRILVGGEIVHLLPEPRRVHVEQTLLLVLSRMRGRHAVVDEDRDDDGAGIPRHVRSEATRRAPERHGEDQEHEQWAQGPTRATIEPRHGLPTPFDGSCRDVLR